MDLTGFFYDLEGFGVAHPLFHGMLAHIATAPYDLDGVDQFPCGAR